MNVNAYVREVRERVNLLTAQPPAKQVAGLRLLLNEAVSTLSGEVGRVTEQADELMLRLMACTHECDVLYEEYEAVSRYAEDLLCEVEAHNDSWEDMLTEEFDDAIDEDGHGYLVIDPEEE